jgi:hypothetical protein
VEGVTTNSGAGNNSPLEEYNGDAGRKEQAKRKSGLSLVRLPTLFSKYTPRTWLVKRCGTFCKTYARFI